MYTMNSFKGYGKVDEVEQQAFKKKTRNRLILISISAALLIGLIVGVVAGTMIHSKDSRNATPNSTVEAIKALCSVTQYPTSCYSSLDSSNSTDPEKIFLFSLSVVKNSIATVSHFTDEYMNETDNPMVKEALAICARALDDAVTSLDDCISSMQIGGDKLIPNDSSVEDLKTWLSTVVTDHETCFDALYESNATFVEDINLLMKNSTEFASNSLAIISKLNSLLGIPLHRRRLLEYSGSFPAWVSAGDRRILQQSNPKADVTVAKDGSGDVGSLKEAVGRIPKKGNKRFVIYVKAGIYVENVELDKSQVNVMIYGDGKDVSIISGSKNFVDGTPTFSTATVGVAGKGFMARDIGFRNTAGAEKHQAVALRSESDKSVFYRCSFNGFQDTLYTVSNRQFYRDCDIIGTVDFIFGNSAVVIQNCTILPRQPMPNQFLTVTAQGKVDPNQNTGISIQRSTIRPFDNITAQTYLGRPWKNYATTVVMQTDIGGFLNPLGWARWLPNLDPPKTIFYAEYQNTGPGARTAGRVKWPGYNPTLTPPQAAKYDVQSFIQGASWLPATTVVFDST